MSDYITSERLVSSVLANITDANAVIAMGSFTSSHEQWMVHEISIANVDAAVDTVLRILGNDDEVYSIAAPSKGGAIKEFRPALPIGGHKALVVKADDSADLTVSLRAFKGSAR